MKYIDHGPDADNKLPPLPTLDSITQAEIDAQQAKMGVNHPINASNREYDNAHAFITQLEQQPLSSLGHYQREQYAEALAITGQYDKAAKITRNKDKAKEWKGVWKAIWLDDAKDCKCKDTETAVMVEGKAEKVTFSRKFKVSRIFSHKHNQFIDLERCNVCQFSNAK